MWIGYPMFTVSIIDFTGRIVKMISYQKLSPGNYSVTFDGNELAEGYYFYRMVAGNFADTKKMTFVKR
jgi:hypothetical protein